MTAADPPTMSRLRALMPEIEAADAIYWPALEAASTNDEMLTCIKAYNEVLRRAAEAIYLDTADINSRSTIMSVYCAPRTPYDTCFGLNPLAALSKWVGGKAA